MESGTAAKATETTSGNGSTAAPGTEQIEVRNPATGETIAQVPVDSPAVVAETVARVRANQSDWEAMGIEGRYHWLGKLRDWILDNQDRILDTMQAETGKVRADISLDLVYVADLINFYGKSAAKYIGDETVRPHSPLL
ncbi:MAG TPA: aldehyde dehydrogenase family protein, partial [Solirubrobacterales bacterium]|nr:aldehyde dehydrogenase family protein [Solirubrobacterales bacterium]